MRDVVPFAERIETIASLHAQLRLEASGRIVDPGVDDAAVVGAGLHPRPGMALEDADARAARAQLRGNRQADHTGADHGNIDVCGHRAIISTD